MYSYNTILVLVWFHIGVAIGARQPYDVKKIIEAFRNPHEDLKILCAHRGLRLVLEIPHGQIDIERAGGMAPLRIRSTPTGALQKPGLNVLKPTCGFLKITLFL